MTAVVAEGRSPDLWADLAARVCRAGERGDRLWVDDSKLVYQGRKGRDRLDAACLAAILAPGRERPETLGHAVRRRPCGNTRRGRVDPLGLSDSPLSGVKFWPTVRSGCGSWQIVEVRSVVVGPDDVQRRPRSATGLEGAWSTSPPAQAARACVGVAAGDDARPRSLRQARRPALLRLPPAGRRLPLTPGLTADADLEATTLRAGRCRLDILADRRRLVRQSSASVD